MEKATLQALAKQVTDSVRGFVSAALAEINPRLDRLEKAPPVHGPKGDKGDSGKDADMPHLVGECKRLVELMRVDGKDGAAGKDGKDGASVSLNDVRPIILAEAARLVKDIPAPKDGERGASGPAGKDGVAGAKGERGEKGDIADPVSLWPKIQEETKNLVLGLKPWALDRLREMLAEVPRAKDGKDGAPGKDGASVKLEDVRPELIAEIARLVHSIPPAIAGPAGPAGQAGKDGKDGVIPVSLIEQTVQNVMAAHPKPKDGAAGKDGTAGKDGVSVNVDSIVLMVNEAVERAIAKIPHPRDGEDGRDASQINPLPSIDLKRSYARGQFADHKGGMVRAVRQTDPLEGVTLEQAGWVVCMKGIASEVEEEQGRIRRRTTTYTDGTTWVRESKTTELRYHGLWKAGAYERGDSVTWNGSGWHCERDTTDEPETSDAWKLMVKRGRDGKSPQPEMKRGPVNL